MSRLANFFTSLRARLTSKIGNVFETVAAVCFVSFFVAILFQVFCRYIAHYPVQWTEELSRLLYVAMISLGAAVAVDEHSRLTLGLDFVKRHSRRGYQLLTLFIDLIALTVLAYVAIGSYSRTLRSWPNFLPATGFRWSYFYIPLLIGAVTLMLYTVLGMCATVFGFQSRNGEGKRCS